MKGLQRVVTSNNRGVQSGFFGVQVMAGYQEFSRIVFVALLAPQNRDRVFARRCAVVSRASTELIMCILIDKSSRLWSVRGVVVECVKYHECPFGRLRVDVDLSLDWIKRNLIVVLACATDCQTHAENKQKALASTAVMVLAGRMPCRMVR